MIVNLRCKRPTVVKSATTGVQTPGTPSVLWEKFVSLFPLSAELRELAADVDVSKRFVIYRQSPWMDVKEGDKLFELVNDEESGVVYLVVGVGRWVTALSVELERIDE